MKNEDLVLGMNPSRALAPRPALLACLLAAVFAAAPALADEYDDVGRLTQAGRFDEALVRADRFLAARPRDPQMRFLKGVIQIGTGQRAQAIDTFNQLTRDTPELPEPYNNLAVIYAEQRDYDKARDTLERAVRARPDYSTAYENLGDVYASLARDSYSQALKRDARNEPLASKLTTARTVFTPVSASGAMILASASTPAVRTAAGPVTMAPASAPAGPATLPALPSAVPATASAPAASGPAPAPAPAGGSGKPTAAAAPATAPLPAPAAGPLVPAPAAPANAATLPAPAAAVGKPMPAAATATPAAAAAAVAPGAPKAAAGAAGADSADVEKAVRSWATAWSGQDLPGYLGAYAADFKPANGQSRSVWEQERRARVGGKARIGVEVRNLVVNVRGETATAQFQQVYSSDKLNETNRKTLELVRRNGSWLITKEAVVR